MAMAMLDGSREAVGRLLRLPRRGQRTGVGVEPWASGLDRRALACCLLALVAIAGGLTVVAAHSGERRAGSNGVFEQAQALVPAGMTACQGGELLPADTAALQIAGLTQRAPLVTVLSGRRVLDRVHATVDARRSTIRAAIRRTRRELANVEVCLGLHDVTALLRGPTPPHVGDLTIGRRRFAGSSIAIDYLLPGRSSWWASAPTVAARMGRGRGQWGGGWAVWAIAALMAASLLLTSIIVLRTLVASRPMPRIAAAIAAVAVCNAAAWSLITPAFQVPDEVGHVAYVQSIGETGRAPAQPRWMRISPEQASAMADAGFGRVGAAAYRAAVWSPLLQRRLMADLRRPLSRRATLPIGEVEPEPPLYYTLEAIPYRLARGTTLLDRVALMRLCSALLAGVTALLSFLFVRECLPARPWAWTVGGLGVALAPMLGFESGGVNPDALLFALAAALFLCVARAWRRGVTPRLALYVGALIAAGMLTKANFLGLVPGALLALALAARRTAASRDRRAVRLVGTTVAVAAVLFAAGVAFESLAWHRPFVLGRPAAPESHVGLWSHLGYIWQVFLPRLPFQPRTALTEPGYVQLLKTFVGAFGSLAVWLPGWAYGLAAAGLVLVGLLSARMLMADWRELRWRSHELVGYAAMSGILLLLIGVSADLRRNLIEIVQGRYLLPLLPLFGVLLALAARGAGDRWGRTAGVAIVWSAVALGVFGQLTTIAFFYS
jgi:hypothetical protein